MLTRAHAGLLDFATAHKLPGAVGDGALSLAIAHVMLLLAIE